MAKSSVLSWVVPTGVDFDIDGDAPQQEDHFVHLDGVPWDDYERLVEIRGERSVPRLTYLEGALELMSPSIHHERIASVIPRLIETYCLEREIRFTTLGSWTIKKRRKRRGAEADDCFIFGSMPRAPRRPDLAIEVTWTSGGIDKLDVWRKLGVPEVWHWEKGRLQPYRLRSERYEPVVRSGFLPDLDLELLARFLERPTTYDAIREYRAALAAESK